MHVFYQLPDDFAATLADLVARFASRSTRLSAQLLLVDLAHLAAAPNGALQASETFLAALRLVAFRDSRPWRRSASTNTETITLGPLALTATPADAWKQLPWVNVIANATAKISFINHLSFLV